MIKIFNFIKDHFYWVLLLVLVIVSICSVLYARKIKSEKEDLQQQVRFLTLKDKATVAKVVKIYTDTTGNIHTIIEKDANKITERALKEGSAIRIGLLDSTAALLKQSKDKIDQITKVNFQISQHDLKMTKSFDSLKKANLFSYKDKFINSTTRVDSTGSAFLDYSVDGSIGWVDYHEKKVPIIGRYYYYTDIFSDNPNQRIKGDLKRVTIEHPYKNVGLRLKLSSTYNFQRKQAFIGTGAEFGFGRFNLSGYGYYDYSANRIIPTVRLDYDWAIF